ncbi:MAG: hypothetical protein RR312_09570 [Bacteroidales bacterium]
MAAGNNVYSIEKDTIQQDGTLYDLFYAKELSAYGSVDNVKALFYLDYVFQSVVAGENVFVGGVRENSNNYYYHKNTRQSVFGLHADGVNYIMLNDAGLNTFASISIKLGRYKYANYMEFVLSVKSSYYSPTTRYGFYVKVDGGAQSERAVTIPLQSGGVINNPNYVIEYIAHKVSQKIELRPYAVNDEGEKVGDMITFYTDDYIHRQLATKIATLYVNPNDGVISNFFLTDTSLVNLGRVVKIAGMYDINVYTNPALTVPVENGLYSIMYGAIEGEVYQGDELGNYKGNRAVVEVYSGRVQKWELGLWTAPPVKSDVYIGITASMVDPNDTNTYKYAINISNTMAGATGDLLVNIWTYCFRNGSNSLTPFKSLGSMTISCPANSEKRYESPDTIFLSNDEIAIGLTASLSSNIAISGPSMVPGKGPRPEH